MSGARFTARGSLIRDWGPPVVRLAYYVLIACETIGWWFRRRRVYWPEAWLQHLPALARRVDAWWRQNHQARGRLERYTERCALCGEPADSQYAGIWLCPRHYAMQP